VSWSYNDGCWFFDDGRARGVLLPVGDIGWEARAVAAGRRMRTERFFTSADAKAVVERWAGNMPDAEPASKEGGD
jgi:hypothetical protein